MSRLSSLGADDLPEGERHLLKPHNVYKLLVHSPGLTRHLTNLVYWIRDESALPARVRELAILQVAYSLANDYSYSHHLEVGHRAGVTTADIEALKVESAGGESSLPASDRNVLLAAREIAEGDGLREATLDSLKEFLSESDIVELLFTVTFYLGFCRFLESLKVEVEPEFATWLAQYPLPRRDAD